MLIGFRNFTTCIQFAPWHDTLQLYETSIKSVHDAIVAAQKVLDRSGLSAELGKTGF